MALSLLPGTFNLFSAFLYCVSQEVHQTMKAVKHLPECSSMLTVALGYGISSLKEVEEIDGFLTREMRSACYQSSLISSYSLIVKRS
jgi:hypothetical protein